MFALHLTGPAAEKPRMKLNERSIAHYATSDAPADKTGHLYKKGERNPAYHRRWFVLKGNMLFYFEDKDSKEPIGVIILEGCTVELCESSEEYAFAIKFDCMKSRVYKMAAESQAAMESWVKALSRASFDYMRLVVRELEKQLDEMQARCQRRLPAVRTKSRPGLGIGAAPAASPQASYNRTNEETVQFMPTVPAKENGVAWNKPSEALNGCVYAGYDGGRPPPVPPRRKSGGGGMVSALESPVSPGTSCFDKLHDWYGKEIIALRDEWLLSQTDGPPSHV
ncbi:sesquipedalian-1 isoform X1 [Polypterus senegalus]|nr:sesquipedalian-1 isoform X1 [Polypterus senegalus]XP_039628112.1 sesquipedalian-1 isoform X1 [Polypterus senegalus]